MVHASFLQVFFCFLLTQLQKGILNHFLVTFATYASFFTFRIERQQQEAATFRD